MTAAPGVAEAAADALIPISWLRDRLGVSERTMARRLGTVTRHRYADGYAVRYGDIAHLIPAPQKGTNT